MAYAQVWCDRCHDSSHRRPCRLPANSCYHKRLSPRVSRAGERPLALALGARRHRSHREDSLPVTAPQRALPAAPRNACHRPRHTHHRRRLSSPCIRQSPCARAGPCLPCATRWRAGARVPGRADGTRTATEHPPPPHGDRSISRFLTELCCAANHERLVPASIDRAISIARSSEMRPSILSASPSCSHTSTFPARRTVSRSTVPCRLK